MEIIASHGFILLTLACVFGLFMAWGIGANDVANAMGTSVGSRALTLKQAIIIAAILSSRAHTLRAARSPRRFARESSILRY